MLSLSENYGPYMLSFQGSGEVAGDEAVDDLDFGRQPGPLDQLRDDSVDGECGEFPLDEFGHGAVLKAMLWPVFQVQWLVGRQSLLVAVAERTD